MFSRVWPPGEAKGAVWSMIFWQSGTKRSPHVRPSLPFRINCSIESAGSSCFAGQNRFADGVSSLGRWWKIKKVELVSALLMKLTASPYLCSLGCHGDSLMHLSNPHIISRSHRPHTTKRPTPPSPKRLHNLLNTTIHTQPRRGQRAHRQNQIENLDIPPPSQEATEPAFGAGVGAGCEACGWIEACGCASSGVGSGVPLDR